MSEIVEKMKYLNDKAKYFQKLKDDENFLYEEIEKISADNVKYVQNLYVNEEKINKIRYEVANLLLNRKFNKENFENLKQNINNQYDTNILQTWKDFSILYIFFFNPIKNIVNEYLKDIGNYFIEKTGKKLKLKTTNFDGTRNLGDVGCWIALYNPKYNSQSEGIQYFMNFYDNNTTYGTYHHETKKDIDRKEYDIENLDENIIQAMIIDLKNQLNTILENDIEWEIEDMLDESKQTQPLNQILYGSPGTGKTYHTINKALEIIFQDKLTKEDYENDKVKEEKLVELSQNELTEDEKKETKNDSRKILKACFEKYKNAGQIEFVTFHQSYGYEEFVEGIKAETKGENINYEVKAGIFKSLVEKSLSKGELASSNQKISEKNVIWKMSLGDSQTGEDKEYFDEAIKTNCLIMGYGDDIDFTSFSTKENIKDKNIDKTTIDMIDRFKNQMKKDDIVIISDGNRKFKAIAIVDGDYFYDSESIYKQKRKIKWLQRFTISRDVKEISEKFFTQATLNKPQWINLDKLNSLISNDKQADNTTKNYVLIIDEINRGNISKIFGELITLIEDSKRLGKSEQVEITLPYSGEKFGVPQNLYIIGTMNTADRSIAPIDTALRRRFVFEEMAPNPNLLKSITVEENGENKVIKINKLLEAINIRIEYLYDRDHTIGHAYLIDVKTLDDLKFAFKNKIIPLLAEYFYEDWENINLVLNSNGFIIPNNENESYLQKIKERIRNKTTYKVSDEKDWNIENFEKIYEITL